MGMNGSSHLPSPHVVAGRPFTGAGKVGSGDGDGDVRPHTPYASWQPEKQWSLVVPQKPY